ncbi:AAA family ATPase [Leptospira sp. 2 VSF19]|uniref:AAA family ATPase n=1 Tax=Leptospira soteropolitanensis TaxID=2950025 RepID=A0AAW5VGV3_9LEPT|nr:AAA family ATPase [Leptospira soteropolitanensis]MCW7492529.1 AAA family ATPase [Leptospira soteropolitanensis]MCW7500577.1 AAA family ATPase [Leptospira soteropolitanensis]MCW7522753.1 AAA family ATPase [Leptospira soteropolitanensis]MCW7526609.1 AAA family ATPase [Leptospira soteropolitanensis]MCW7530547.1 AAA family ATPase [Leptospira soteropolitanensis]
MRNLKFNEILILTLKEKKAFQFKVGKKLTVVHGGNESGKSTLLKSIYWAFGADPIKMHKNWVTLDPIVCVKFNVDLKEYSILRYKNKFSIFSKESGLIGSYSSVGKELTPVLSKILGYRLILTDRKNKAVIPPPAFIFLPFYFDQDKSWVDAWSSFSSLEQFTNWKSPLIDYHSGIKSDEYYTYKSKRDYLKSRVKETESQILQYERIGKTIRKRNKNIIPELNEEKYKIQIQKLMKSLMDLRIKQDAVRLEYQKLIEHLHSLTQQESILKSKIQSINKNYKHSLTLPEIIFCPTCGADYKNDFETRFTLANSEEECIEFLTDVQNEKVSYEEKIINFKNRLNNIEREVSFLNTELESNNEKLSLKKYLEIEGKNEAQNTLNNFRERLIKILGNRNHKIHKIDEHLKEFSNEEKKNIVIATFEKSMRDNVKSLNASGVSEETFKNIAGNIRELGSLGPRALLAYYFAYLETIIKNGSGLFCPIIIDSPNQQAQDKLNHKAILTFIQENQLKDSQIILGVEELHSLQHNKDIIHLEGKKNLLKENQYKKVKKMLDPYLASIFQSDN